MAVSAKTASALDKSWESSGRPEFISNCKSCVEDDAEFRSRISVVCGEVLRGNLSPTAVIAALTDVIPLSKSGPTILTDVLLLYDLETQASEKKDERDRFIRLLSNCNSRLVSESLLKERLDVETAGDAYIIPDKKSASTKFIKLKTRLFYKQQKYNLLREESEGYSKLITELSQDEEFDIDYMLKVIRSLIGCFNLDPNRVLDIILECFENRPKLHKCYIPLIRQFFHNSNTLSQLLAFKFSFYQSIEAETYITPQSLYIVTALVVSEGLISLEELYPFLTPSDALIREHCDHELAEAKAIAKKAAIISTAEEKPKEEKFNREQQVLLFVNNQKLGLCAALLKIGNWDRAQQLVNFFPEYYATADRRISKYLATLILIGIDSLYRENSGLPPQLQAKLKPYKADAICTFKPVSSANDLREKVFPMISTLGAFMHTDTILMTKLIRLGKALLAWNSTDLTSCVLDMLEDAILPALSLVVSNCGICEELWGLLKRLPYGTRYRLYATWKNDWGNPLLITTRASTLKRIKYIMKRLSKENVKMSGRQIGKLSHSNPSYLFDYVLSQIQSYDNLIGPVVDALKFLTSVSYDVLVYCIIEALADSKKGRTKHDGASISPWLLSLGNFCGSVVRKYPVELPGLLQHIANQLKNERSLDLFVLKEIVNKMAGIEATEELTNEQLSALSGGELLRAECGYFNQVRNTRKSSNRLKDALIEGDLVMPLCMLMAQQRHCILFNEQEHSHLKLIGKLYDQCQETLVQYGSFLSNTLSIDDYISCLPSLEKLMTEFNLSADVAFFLVRPMIMHHITLKFFELRKGEKPLKSNAAYLEAWESVTQPVVDAVIPALKSKFWDDLSPRLYVSFWTLAMYDLEVPKQSYDREVDRLKQQIQAAEENKDMPASKKKKEVERGRLLQEKLLEEQLKQDEHVRRVRYRLEQEKEQWFQSNSAKSEMTTQFFQHCLFPRCIFTASDSLYCAKFVHLLHTLKTPNFSTLICFDRIFGDISYTMCSCTENEANHYGRFLCSILEVVMRWHADINVFNQECAKFPGFVTKFTEKDPVHVDYESYRHVCHKWHYRLTKAFILCLDSEDYIQIRNSLLILTKIQAYFPVISTFAQAIEKRVENTRKNEKDKRPDLYALATGYAGQLKLKKPHLVVESEFHLKENKKAPTSLPASSSTAKSEPEGPAPPPAAAAAEVNHAKENETHLQAVVRVESNGTENSAAVVKGEQRIVSSNIRRIKEPGEILEKERRNSSKEKVKRPDSEKTKEKKPSESNNRNHSERDVIKEGSRGKQRDSSSSSAGKEKPAAAGGDGTPKLPKPSQRKSERPQSTSEPSKEAKRRKIESESAGGGSRNSSPQTRNHEPSPRPKESGRERGERENTERTVSSSNRKGDDSTTSSPGQNSSVGRTQDKKGSSRKRDISEENAISEVKRTRRDDDVKPRVSSSSSTRNNSASTESNDRDGRKQSESKRSSTNSTTSSRDRPKEAK